MVRPISTFSELWPRSSGSRLLPSVTSPAIARARASVQAGEQYVVLSSPRGLQDHAFGGAANGCSAQFWSCAQQDAGLPFTNELRHFFHACGDYFVSYYDTTNQATCRRPNLHRKDSSLNEEVARLRHSPPISADSATSRGSTVSRSTGSAAPEYVIRMVRGCSSTRWSAIPLRRLVGTSTPATISPAPRHLRVRGDTLEVFPM